MPQKYVNFTKKNKKLIGHLKKLILFNQSMVLDFSTSCHIFFIKTVIEAKKNIKKCIFMAFLFIIFLRNSIFLGIFYFQKAEKIV